jgi:hypothetical protein
MLEYVIASPIRYRSGRKSALVFAANLYFSSFLTF